MLFPFTGQIALVSGGMTLVERNLRPQYELTLSDTSRVIKTINSRDGQLRDVMRGVCFVTHLNYITKANRQLERQTTNTIIEYIALPRKP